MLNYVFWVICVVPVSCGFRRQLHENKQEAQLPLRNRASA